MFSQIATVVSLWMGKPIVFLGAVAAVVIWAICGPLFDYSEGWQLTINTGTTIITFLMVFLIQNAQNRSGAAIQAKLDELIRTQKDARDTLIGIEDQGDEVIEEVKSSC